MKLPVSLKSSVHYSLETTLLKNLSFSFKILDFQKLPGQN